MKGKYFEVLVRDRLNAGESVGELQLQPGQVATLVESPTQPGIDLLIKNEDGSTDELLQLKASESLGYVRRAFDRYPDIRVVTPSEVDDTAGITIIYSAASLRMTRPPGVFWSRTDLARNPDGTACSYSNFLSARQKRYGGPPRLGVLRPPWQALRTEGTPRGYSCAYPKI